MKALLLAALLSAVAIPVARCCAQNSNTSSSTEALAMAVYYFGKFVFWPDELGSFVAVCMHANSPRFDTFRRHLRARAFGERQLVIVPVVRSAQIQDCDFVLIDEALFDYMSDIQSAAHDRPVLIVGMVPGVIASGGMVELLPQDSRIVVRLALDSARNQGFSFSAELLQLAEIVNGDANPGAPPFRVCPKYGIP